MTLRTVARPSSWFRALERVPLVLRACLAAVLSAAFGIQCMCANVAYSRAYEAHVSRELAAYRHAGTMAEVATDMVGVLSDRGYVNEPSTVAETLETEWKATSTEARERVRVAMSMDAEGVFVRATVITEGLSAQKWATEIRTTAVELERALLGSIQPEIAQSSSDADLRVHDYSTAAPVLWDALKRVAAEAGAYFDAYDPPIDTVAATRWIKGAEGETRWRYEARFESRGDGRTRVRVDRAVEKAVGERRWIAEGETRDLSLEWALIERRDPERAMAIEEVARRKAHDAFEEAVARGAPACVGCRGCRGT